MMNQKQSRNFLDIGSKTEIDSRTRIIRNFQPIKNENDHTHGQKVVSGVKSTMVDYSAYH